MKGITRIGLFSVLAVAMAVTPLAACGTSGYYVENEEVWVDRAPPPPRYEHRPMMPGPDYVWVGGYWYWTGRGYTWRSGFWDRAPYAGHVWVNSGWVFQSGRYRYVAGRWSAPARAPHRNYVTRPLPPAYRPTRPGTRTWNNDRNRPRPNSNRPAPRPNSNRPAPRR